MSIGIEALRYDFGDETEANDLGFRMTVGSEVDVVRFTASRAF